MLAYAHSKFSYVMILTNGTIIDSTHIRAIESIVDLKGTFPVQVSIDAINPKINLMTRGNPKRVLENIGVLKELGADIVIAMVITRYNVDYVIESIIDLSRYTRHFHLMSVQGVRCIQGIEEKFQLTNDRQTKFWMEVSDLGSKRDLIIDTPLSYEGYGGCASGAPCMAAYSHIVVDPTLNVRPCDRLVDVTIGDLNKKTILEIWNSDAVIPFLTSPVPFCRA